MIVCMVSPLEILWLLTALSCDDIDEIISEDKWHTLPLYTKLALEVTQKVPKVNMHQLQQKQYALWIKSSLEWS